MDNMIKKTNIRSFQKHIGEYTVVCCQLKGKLSIQLTKSNSHRISRYEMREEDLPEQLKNCYGSVQNLFDYMDVNQNSIVRVERDLIVIKTYKGKDCTLGLMKGSSVIF